MASDSSADLSSAISSALNRFEDTVTSSFPKRWKWLGPARLIVGIATTIFIVGLNWQTWKLNESTSKRGV